MAVNPSIRVPDVLALEACGPGLAGVVGGKALGLGSLIAHGLPVPEGFVVTADAFRRSIGEADLGAEIAHLLDAAGGPAGDASASRAIQALFTDELLDRRLAEAIDAAYAGLGQDVLVAVRSSATAEDTAEASFAGQQETYLGVRGAEDVRRRVVRCWASLFTPQAIGYRRAFSVPADGLAMAVVVQRMVAARAAGVMMTIEPVTGDASQLYVEAALGLGEGVVRGDVGVDRLWVSKDDLRVRREEVGHKSRAHLLDPATGAVRGVDVEPGARREPALRRAELEQLARLGRLVERRFGAAMDVEWAVGPGRDGDRQLFLLQARPETVWSGRGSGAPRLGADAEDWDPLHTPALPDEHWSRANIGEAIPGVQTPLSWTTWADAIEVGTRSTLRAIGALSRADGRAPADPAARYLRAFYGRAAMQVDFLARLGDRMPGTTGRLAVTGVLGEVPPTMAFAPTRRRYPAIAWRLPVAFATTPARARAFAADTDAWYRSALNATELADLQSTRAAYAEARSRFNRAMFQQVLVLLSNVQPLFDAITQMVERTGKGDVGVLSGSGGAEMAVVEDIWRVAHGELAFTDLIARHGFHGPAEGELSSTVWREDPAPLERLVGLYVERARPSEACAEHERASMQREVVRAVAPWQRPAARWLLSQAAERILLRGMCKRSFLQCFDVCRAVARRAGALLERSGVLAAADDVFFLTADELVHGPPAGVRELVELRRERRAHYQGLELPEAWRGAPVPLPLSAGAPAEAGGDEVVGVGVSTGVAEGRVRVVLDPSFADVRPGEVLVAPVTDPSWSSVMFVSRALVVDIGGALSHAAVVAREMRIPCVVNTRTGTRLLRDGDRVRVDGTTGVVTVLERCRRD